MLDRDTWLKSTKALLELADRDALTPRVPNTALDLLRQALSALHPEGKLPCDVHLPPNTYIRKGCDLSTLLLAISKREKFPVESTTFAELGQKPREGAAQGSSADEQSGETCPAQPEGNRLEHGRRVRVVAAYLSAERIQGWANPLVASLVDAADFLEGKLGHHEPAEVVAPSDLQPECKAEAVAQWQVWSDEADWVNEDAGMIDHWVSKGRKVRALYALLPVGQPRGDGWQTMESAPKDGARVLIYEPGKPVAIAHYNPTSWQWSNRYKATHWMPAPASPQGKEHSDED